MVDKEKELLVPATATVVETENVEQSGREGIVELKQMKAKAKSAFTKVRRHLLVLIQDEEVDVDNIAKMCDTLDESEQETMDVMLRLSERYKGEKDSQTSCYKLSQEIEQLEIEYTSAQNRAQEVIDSKLSKLSKKPAYQPDERGSGSHTVKIKIPEQSQLQSASFSQPTTNSGNGLFSTEQSVFGNDQGNSLNESSLIGHDLWRQLKRVTIPMFSGDKKTYQNWKAAFMACIDKAPATAQYKLLQLRQCLTGEALKVIESLGYSAAAYETAKDRLERKFGGQRRQIALYLEEIDNFRPVRCENSRDLEKYADLLDVAIVNLKEANRFEELRDGLLYIKLQKKLPASMLTQYHRWIFENHKIESVEVLREWVIREAEFQTKALETVQGLTGRVEARSNTRGMSHTFFGRSNPGGRAESQGGNRSCKMCNKQHGVWTCSEFKELEVPKRWEHAKKLKLCFRCLGEGHLGQHCFRTRVCGLNGCQEVHHRLLHQVENNSSDASASEHTLDGKGQADKRKQEKRQNQQSSNVAHQGAVSSTEGESKQKEQQNNTTMMSKEVSVCGNIALRTIPVYLKSGNRKLKVNALLDDASTKTYVNADVAAELGLQGHPQRVNVSVLNGQVETFETTPIDCFVESLDGKSYRITAFTTSRVTGNMNVIDWNTCAREWPHLKGLNFPQLGPRPIVDLLIGLDCADLHYSFRGRPGQPIARLTPLGWTCIGALSDIRLNDPKTYFARTYFASDQVTMEDVNVVLRQFWEIESGGVESLPTLTTEEKMVVEKVEKSIKFIDGHYQVAIPWKENKLSLPDNYKMAFQRLQNLEKRLTRDPDVATAYSETIEKYLDKGYVRKIEMFEEQPTVKWYLPHFAVVRTDRATTKTRVVFDASAKCNGISLNDMICQGPKLQRELIDVLLRFRRYPVAVVCDIAEMYLRIELCPEDRSCHRFLWRNLDISKKPCEYEFSRLMFGINASPFLAQFVSQQHATMFEQIYPRAAETILKSTYMDDSMDSVMSEIEGINLYKQLSELWQKAGMHAHKWLSNSQAVFQMIPFEDRACQLELNEDNPLAMKTLGIIWLAEEDVFTFKSKVIEEEFKPTKRNVLKKISTLFDPLGFLSPFIIRAKMIMQEMWIAGTGWDDLLSDELTRKINLWFSELGQLQDLRIPRCLQQKKEAKEINLHTFVDASQGAYGAVVYVRVEYKDQTVSVRLVAAKTKVAPLQSVGIPRMELMGACLGVKLTQSIVKVLLIPIQYVVFWCDSTSVLWWIRGHGKIFKPFVANRIGELQLLTNPDQWRYVPTESNPADYLTRGLKVSELVERESWWEVPKYLQDIEERWPKNKVPCASKQAKNEIKRKYLKTDQLCETRAQILADIQDATLMVLENSSNKMPWRLNPERFSSWKRFTRIYAWVMRFVHNCHANKEHRLKGELTLDEIRDAEKQIIKNAQNEAFNDEYSALQKEKQLPMNSKLLGLCPKLDEDGLLRSDSRLQYAEFLPYDVRYPIILPRRNRVTKLIVKHYHEMGHHNAGTNQTLSALSTKYWIIAAREEIVEWEKECAACIKRKAKCAKQIMAPLPLNRLKLSLRAFTRTAVDFGGPFVTIQGRGKQRQKRYLCLFTCLASRAVHLEVAYGLDTDSFLRAFYRMSNRRGVPEEMISDNGTNFVGANQELRKLINQMLQNSKLKESLTCQRIKWTFNPPSAPHFGGVFETMIKAAKRAILAILGNADVNDEELMTAFAGAEALINSRPLTYQSANPEDNVPLTPNHFLQGQIGGQFAPEAVEEVNYNPKKRWRRIQELTKHFWHRWMREWVPSLSSRRRWYQSRKNLQVNDIVLLVSPESPRSHWPLGKVIEVYPGKDGHIRSVKLQVGDKQLVRPIVKLCPLELDCSV